VKSVKNFRYVEKTSAECNEDSYLAILHLSRVELHCKLQEKLHRVTWPLEKTLNSVEFDKAQNWVLKNLLPAMQTQWRKLGTEFLGFC
jgi:hypothetical protein